MKHIKRTRGFTLIELLVVITIIGILAGLAVPAIGTALANAKQTADVVNARQLGIVLFSIANDEGGVYPLGPRDATSGLRPTTAVATSTLLFNGLLADRDLSEPKILATNGKIPYKGSLATPTLAAANVGWDITVPLTTSSEAGVPLLASTGPFTNTSGFSAVTIPDVSPSITNVWGNKGVVIYTVGNSASFVKGRSGGRIDRIMETVPTGLTLARP